MTELALLLMVAAAGHGLSRWSGVPVIPILLGLGMALSFTGMVKHPDLAAGAEMREDPLFFVLELGLTVLVFASGVELNPRRFRRQRRSVLWVGIVQFAAMGAVGFAGGRLLGFVPLEAAYLGFAVSASSTVVGLRQLQLSQQSFEPHGRMVVGVLLLQDALTMGVLIALAHAGSGIAGLAEGYGWAALMAGVAWVLQRGVAWWIIERFKSDEESMLLGALMLLFVFLGAAYAAGLPLIIGAFLAGYSLSNFPVNGLVGGLLHSLVDFFRAVFFVALGALVTVPGAGMVVSAAVLALLVLVITPPLVAAVAEWSGFTGRRAIESGLLLAQTSEFSLVLGLVGMRLGHLSGETFSVVALMAVATMTCTPLLARDSVARWLLRLHPLRQRKHPPSLDREGHVLLLGLGSAGMYVVDPLRAAGVPLLVVDDDPAVILKLDREGVPCLRGDGGDEEVLERAGASKARLVVASMHRVSDAMEVLDRVSGVPVLVRVFEEADAEAVRRRGGIPVSSAEAAAEEFMKWIEAK
ncbi:MAG: cation:proton antiporter [Verrucomicrobiales bacterium]